MHGIGYGPPEGRPLRRTAAARHRIVDRATDYLCLNMDRPIYAEDLGNALGVSASALAEAFDAVAGTSPHRFLKLRRLVMVRTVLLDRKRDRPLAAILIRHIAAGASSCELGVDMGRRL